ncbi:hypothetical protein RBSWK_00017 [Rhodopirellula baltica SWK14]|uniref:Uncharacterized protein n=1 Tax=Rhodopirellula baltica SWK14 TaxID=993516 RepID=L7CPR7_RHOBT|nr:hypothetical protein RBSWK_00017 [Rhodopirellula baltica SWK14]
MPTPGVNGNSGPTAHHLQIENGAYQLTLNENRRDSKASNRGEEDFRSQTSGTNPG